MSLVLDAYGRPVLHANDIIAIRYNNGVIREPLRVMRVTWRDSADLGSGHRIYFKEAMDSKEEWEFAHDVAVKLLARHHDDA